MSTGFIGAGNLARAIVIGLLDKQVLRSSELTCVSGSGSTAQALSKETGIGLAASRIDLLKGAKTVVLAFKPQHLDTITDEEGLAARESLVISVLAGRTLDSMQAAFPLARNLVRVMPNTPSRIGKGVSAYCFLKTPSDQDRQLVESLLGALGTCYEVEESQMHIVTAVSGCGPAVFFQFIDYIAQAAEKRGLERKLAETLAIETGIGSLQLMHQSNQAPAQLVDEVVSPNGVTHALITSLADSGWSGIIDTAMESAVNRSIELSKPT
jgi:pyrroline-5-carboxylate reductase